MVLCVCVLQKFFFPVKMFTSMDVLLSEIAKRKQSPHLFPQTWLQKAFIFQEVSNFCSVINIFAMYIRLHWSWNTSRKRHYISLKKRKKIFRTAFYYNSSSSTIFYFPLLLWLNLLLGALLYILPDSKENKIWMHFFALNFVTKFSLHASCKITILSWFTVSTTLSENFHWIFLWLLLRLLNHSFSCGLKLFVPSDIISPFAWYG